MQKQGATWHYLAALVMLASCGASLLAGAEGDSKDPPKPLPPEIVKAWRDAGFEVGWMKADVAALQKGLPKCRIATDDD